MKEIIKKIGLGLATVSVLALTVLGLGNSSAYAAAKPQDALCTGVGYAIDGVDCTNGKFEIKNVFAFVGTAVQWLLWAVGVVCVIFIIIGGIKYATSGGDAEKVKKAKNTLLYACIGLAIALLAGVIVSLVTSLSNTIGGSTANN
jgi:hypothetical protein